MKSLFLASIFAAAPAAAQTRARPSLPQFGAAPGIGASFDGARLDPAPLQAQSLTPSVLIPAPAAKPVASAALAGPVLPAASLSPRAPAEFSRVPDWFDASKLEFDALIKSGDGGIAVLRYGWRKQFEMSVFAFPGGDSISFKEYPASPMGNPKRSFEAALETASGRAAAAKILRAANERNPVSGKDKAVLDRILAFLEGN